MLPTRTPLPLIAVSNALRGSGGGVNDGASESDMVSEGSPSDTMESKVMNMEVSNGTPTETYNVHANELVI